MEFPYHTESENNRKIISKIDPLPHLISTPPPKTSKLLLLKPPFKFWNSIHKMLHVKLSFMKYIVFYIFMMILHPETDIIFHLMHPEAETDILCQLLYPNIIG